MQPHYLWLAAHRKSQKMCFCMKVRLSKSFRRQLRTCLARSQLFHLALDLLFLVYNLLNLIKLKYGLPGSSMNTKHSQTNEMLRTEIFTALLVRGLHKISQAALAGLCRGACQNPSWVSYLWVDSWQETSHFHPQGKEVPAPRSLLAPMNGDMFSSCNREGGAKHRWQAVKDFSGWYTQGIRQSPASCCSFGQLEAFSSEKVQSMPSWADPYMKVRIGWGVGPWSLYSEMYK